MLQGLFSFLVSLYKVVFYVGECIHLVVQEISTLLLVYLNRSYSSMGK